MADSTINSANEVERWADEAHFEFVRASPFSSLMGPDENSVIHAKEDLTKEKGSAITFPFIGKLTNDAVLDDNTLESNEEDLDNYGYKVTVHQHRNGVRFGSHEQIKSSFDAMKAARTMVKIWKMEELRDQTIAVLLSPVVDGTTTYAASTEAQRDAWLTAQNPSTSNQRVLFGAARSNYSTGDHSASLTTIDATNDDLHQDIISLAKRMAQGCDPHIRPVMASDSKGAGHERFIALAGSLPFRDLVANYATVLSGAGVRGDDNKLFSSGDLLIGNVVVKEVPELDRAVTAKGAWIENVGDGATVDVEPVFFLGAQAVSLAWAKRLSFKTDTFDYGNKHGVAVADTYGIGKTMYNSFQHGMVTAYVSAAAD